eukprot:1326570-Amorphochlora_amoeboformis.AAC.1
MPSDVRQTPQPTASHLDTDFVSYKNKAGVKFEVFTLTGAAEAFRKSGGDIQKVLADQHVYLSVKKKKRHSTANLAREFQTDNMLEIAEIIVLKGKIKVGTIIVLIIFERRSKVYKPSPITERIMDFIFFLEAVYALRVLLEKDMFPTFLTMLKESFVVSVPRHRRIDWDDHVFHTQRWALLQPVVTVQESVQRSSQ